MVGFTFDYVCGIVYNGRLDYIYSDANCDQCVLSRDLGCVYSRIKKASCWMRIW